MNWRDRDKTRNDRVRTEMWWHYLLHFILQLFFFQFRTKIVQSMHICIRPNESPANWFVFDRLARHQRCRCVRIDNDPIFILLFAFNRMRRHAGNASGINFLHSLPCAWQTPSEPHTPNRPIRILSSASNFNYFIETMAEPNPDEYLLQLLV